MPVGTTARGRRREEHWATDKLDTVLLKVEGSQQDKGTAHT